MFFGAFFFGQVQWRDSERISRRMLRSEAARPAAGLEDVRERGDLWMERKLVGGREEDAGEWRRG